MDANRIAEIIGAMRAPDIPFDANAALDLVTNALADYFGGDGGCDCNRDTVTLEQLGHNIRCARQTFDRARFLSIAKGE